MESTSRIKYARGRFYLDVERPFLDLIKGHIQHWQYNPYGSVRHNFSFYWLTHTGRGSFIKAIWAGIIRPQRYK